MGSKSIFVGRKSKFVGRKSNFVGSIFVGSELIKICGHFEVKFVGTQKYMPFVSSFKPKQVYYWFYKFSDSFLFYKLL